MGESHGRVDLIRRVTGEHVHALTTTLLTKADGTKFGKTESGAVWLDPGFLTSPYAFYQFWINADDRDLPSLLNTFSLRPLPELAEVLRGSAASPHLRIGQRALADELTTTVHGREQAKAVVAACCTFSGRGELESLDAATLTGALRETPHLELSGQLREQTPLTELFARVGLVDSKAAARRAAKEGGVRQQRPGR